MLGCIGGGNTAEVGNIWGEKQEKVTLKLPVVFSTPRQTKGRRVKAGTGQGRPRLENRGSSRLWMMFI